ncbi:hypothetical protein BHYA_0077g00430 [Botrytis hyacinthi]|uniref:Uncharacterized protein n=1 Tax=Botrytis hyacinthi TaxID=278943 RepID=A0A4Z1GRY9_9HELO|nr:hypothetical protein BHYA_0077g00430 [Botrytis hyacinthi]
MSLRISQKEVHHKSKDPDIPIKLEQIRKFGLKPRTTQRAKKDLVSQIYSELIGLVNDAND